MEQEIQRRPRHELQLLPTSQIPPWPSSDHHIPRHHQLDPPASSLDLQLSISLRPLCSPTDHHPPRGGSKFHKYSTNNGCGLVSGGGGGKKNEADAVKWEAAEQIRLAAMEKAYAERVRELARKEMEMAQTELARASHVWEKAKEEVEKAERLKERATSEVLDGGACMEITCHCCRQRFIRP